MIAVIFGRSSCPYCVRAKELATKLTSERDDFNYQYVDIQATGITKADLEARAGRQRPQPGQHPQAVEQRGGQRPAGPGQIGRASCRERV